jgi:DNA-binding response OmpR family regulator
MAQPLRSHQIETQWQSRSMLVVQHNPFVASSLARYLTTHIDRVVVAADPGIAESFLRDATLSLTDLICGQRFGSRDLTGTELIPRWRGLCPTLQRVALVTASDDVPEGLDGIDAVFQKPIDPSAILAFFIASDPPSGPIRRLALHLGVPCNLNKE